ncbi:DUF4352 domain-containing protein [Actinoplanes sp. NPDC049599]|uniref:DUF4352 domain-containing protein n=1 Tax=Actinoplanes sp. NPDC049599 TaxID=3363903 RepID=UPI0037A0B018
MSYDPNQPYQPPVAPGYGPPPGHPMAGPPPVAKKGNAKLIIGIVGGLLGLCCVGGTIAAVASGDDKPDVTVDEVAAPLAEQDAAGTKPAPAKKTTAAPAPKAGPGLGDPVRDGKFEFVVSKVDCSKTKVGSTYLNKKAQGKFCQVSVKVKNIGKEAQYFDGSSQKAMDAKGTEFSNDGTAELYANEDNATFLNEINPGNSAKGRLIFDVPKSVKLTAVELHDSPFSGGVEVSLS